MDIREILLHIRAGSSNRQIERDTKIDRRTIKHYKDWAKTQGLLAGPLPSLEELQVLADQTVPKQTPPQNVSSVAPYRDLIEQLVKENVEIAAITCRLEVGVGTNCLSEMGSSGRIVSHVFREESSGVSQESGEVARPVLENQLSFYLRQRVA